MKPDEKRHCVFEAAATVFSQYGFRRTSMNDIAQAAGISRPALYLLFDNKEDLFLQLANFRQAEAIEEAVMVLSEDAPVQDRVVRAILAYERIYYEPVAASPHGAEFMDMHKGTATQDMVKGRGRLVGHIAASLEGAIAAGELALSDPRMTPAEFAELLMLAINGMKKAATSVGDFRKKIRDVTSIFMASTLQPADTRFSPDR